MAKRFKPSFVRDRNVILADIAYAKTILKNKPDDESLKQNINELYDELSYTKPPLLEGIFKRIFKR